MRFLCATLTTLLLVAAGCDSGSECGEPLYAAEATDEVWRALVDARKRPPNTSQAVTLLSPTQGQVYAAGASPPRWEWSSPLQSSLSPQAPGALASMAAPRRERSWSAWLGELLLPTAHAHLPPVTGDMYWLEVSTAGRTCPVVQVLTSELAWQVDAASWEALGQVAGQELRLQVTSAYVLQNQVTEGPYSLATPLTFRRAAP